MAGGFGQFGGPGAADDANLNNGPGNGYADRYGDGNKAPSSYTVVPAPVDFGVPTSGPRGFASFDNSDAGNDGDGDDNFGDKSGSVSPVPAAGR